MVLGFAHKECGSDGVWFQHPETNKTWSNYTTCVDLDDFEVSTSINYCYSFHINVCKEMFYFITFHLLNWIDRLNRQSRYTLPLIHFSLHLFWEFSFSTLNWWKINSRVESGYFLHYLQFVIRRNKLEVDNLVKNVNKNAMHWNGDIVERWVVET